MDFPRHLLELEALTRGQIEALLSLAARFKRERAKETERMVKGNIDKERDKKNLEEVLSGVQR